jgi:hypothetical protein
MNNTEFGNIDCRSERDCEQRMEALVYAPISLKDKRNFVHI